MLCPECHSPMTNGFVPAREGIFFFRGQPQPDIAFFAESLPNTSAFLRRAMLEAYKCTRCQLILIRYGKQVDDPKTFEHK